MKIKINNRLYKSPKILNTEEERQIGYQYLDKEDIDQTNECLVFVFEDEQDNRQFHMRNCEAFDIKLYALNADKELVDKFLMHKGTNETYQIHGPCKYVVEVPVIDEL